MLIFNPDICLHVHSAECTVRSLNQAGRNNNPHSPNLWEKPGIEPEPTFIIKEKKRFSQILFSASISHRYDPYSSTLQYHADQPPPAFMHRNLKTTRDKILQANV